MISLHGSFLESIIKAKISLKKLRVKESSKANLIARRRERNYVSGVLRKHRL